MASLTQLRSDHAELAELCAAIATLIERDTPPPSIELFEARRRLKRKLVAHLEAEDRDLYPHLVDHDDPRIAGTARQFVVEMGGLAAAFDGYTAEWDPERIVSDWPGYQRDTRGILEALRNRIGRENRELYPLLERMRL